MFIQSKHNYLRDSRSNAQPIYIAASSNSTCFELQIADLKRHPYFIVRKNRHVQTVFEKVKSSGGYT